MIKLSAKLASFVLAASIVFFGAAVPANADNCGNGTIQPGEVCDSGDPTNATVRIGCCAAGCATFSTGGTVCRPATGSICDGGAETCSGTSGACPADIVSPSTQLCRASLGVCDFGEFCDGTSGACPEDIVEDAGVDCRASAGVCDPVEECDGSTGACPGDAKSSSVCRPDAGSCDAGSESCDGTNDDCPADNVSTLGTLCRPSQGDCDPTEVCDGTSGACPGDLLSPTSVVCRPAGPGGCDFAENCTGVDPSCPPDVVGMAGDICRDSAGVCDPQEECDGTSSACPSDTKSTSVCRPDSGVCDDGAEFCDGTNDDCPDSEPANEGSLCRPSGGFCDPAEECDGTSSDCPEDDKSTSVCRVAAGDCDIAESCDGTNDDCPVDDKSTDVCRPPVHVDCDVAESCDGTSVDCPEDELTPDCQAEDDGLECTEATCVDMGDHGECVTADNCVEICRGPGFWQNHSGDEKDGENIGQAVLDEVGSLEVCGEEISVTTDLGDLDSALEGLCVRTQGVHQRQLYRVLVTTALNCAISEGTDCDDVLEGIVDVKFSECSALCAGDPVPDGPTEGECKDQLGCFNKGGKWIDGGCALGTCSEDTEEYCGADHGDCPDEQDCVRFPDSCAKQDLCSEDLADAPAQICPKPGPASSPKICNEARHNECTIDYCYDPADYSCEGICGGQAESGCWCDSLSCSIGDGCADRDYFCDVCP